MRKTYEAMEKAGCAVQALQASAMMKLSPPKEETDAGRSPSPTDISENNVANNRNKHSLSV
jgi:hypothetical protein